jgi:hypothetical protein
MRVQATHSRGVSGEIIEHYAVSTKPYRTLRCTIAQYTVKIKSRMQCCENDTVWKEMKPFERSDNWYREERRGAHSCILPPLNNSSTPVRTVIDRWNRGSTPVRTVIWYPTFFKSVVWARISSPFLLAHTSVQNCGFELLSTPMTRGCVLLKITHFTSAHVLMIHDYDKKTVETKWALLNKSLSCN